MGYFVALAIAAGFAVPVAVLSAAIGQGLVGSSAMSAIARQPEAGGKIQMAMIIALALVFFLLKGSLPATSEILKILAAH